MSSNENDEMHPIMSFCMEEDNIFSNNCVVKQLSATDERLANALDFLFLLYAASLVFFMQAGFAMVCAGSVRKICVQNSMLKNIMDACGAALGFWSFGYAFAYGDGSSNSFIGATNFFLSDLDVSQYTMWLFQYAFAATSATIVVGTLAERCQMTAYLVYSFVLTGFVYPVVARAVWSEHGFLNYDNGKMFGEEIGIGVIDFAGSGVVHITGGTTAFMATKILKPRKGRFHDIRGRKLDVPTHFPGHSAALQVIGTFILWFAWYGFNAGSIQYISGETGTGYPQFAISALAAVNTTLAASAGCISALFMNLYWSEHKTGEPVFDLLMALNGSLSGLVAITAGCSVVQPWSAVIIGIVSGLVYLLSSRFLIRQCIDDAVDAIPVHFFNGIWGIISVGLFATPENISNLYGPDDLSKIHAGLFIEWGRGRSDAYLLAAQVVCILFIIVWVLGIMTPFFVILNYVGWLRSEALEEIVGVDYDGTNLTNLSLYAEAPRSRSPSFYENEDTIDKMANNEDSHGQLDDDAIASTIVINA